MIRCDWADCRSSLLLSEVQDGPDRWTFCPHHIAEHYAVTRTRPERDCQAGCGTILPAQKAGAGAPRKYCSVRCSNRAQWARRTAVA